MRTAIISDIHSNLSALEAVLADIDQRKVQRIICLGDLIGYGPDPVACADLVAERCEWSLLGNHDFGVLYEPTNFNSAAEQAAYWTRRQFEAAAKEDTIAGERRWNFLGHLKVRVNDNNYLCVHGSPRRPINEYLFPDDAINNPHKLESIFGRFDTTQECSLRIKSSGSLTNCQIALSTLTPCKRRSSIPALLGSHATAIRAPHMPSLTPMLAKTSTASNFTDFRTTSTLPLPRSTRSLSSTIGSATDCLKDAEARLYGRHRFPTNAPSALPN